MALIFSIDSASSSTKLDATQLGVDPSSGSSAHSNSGASTLSAPPLHTRLAGPITSTDQLLELLVPPLVRLGALPQELVSSLLSSSSSSSSVAAPPQDPAKFIKRQLALVQRVILERIWPDWEHALSTELQGSPISARQLLSSWFIPDPNLANTDASSLSNEIALSALQVLCSCLSTHKSSPPQSPLHPRSIHLVVRILSEWVTQFSLERTYRIIFAGEGVSMQVREDRWERILKTLMGMPILVANRMGELTVGKRTLGQNVPQNLHLSYQTKHWARSFSELLHTLSKTTDERSYSIISLSTTLSTLLSHPDIIPTLLNSTVYHLLPPETFPVAADLLLSRQRLAGLWQEVILDMSDRYIARLLRLTLSEVQKPLFDVPDPSTTTIPRCHAASWLLSELFGPLGPEREETWNLAFEMITDRTNVWNGKEVEMARVVLGFLGKEEKTRIAALDLVMRAWCDASSIQTAGASNRIFLSTLLILLISSLPPAHPSLISLSRSTTFIQAISTHLTLLQTTVRLLGMLIAEIVSAKALPEGSGMKALSFGEEIWEGNGEGRSLCRFLRGVEKGNAEDTKGWQELLRFAFVESRGEALKTELDRVPKRSSPAPIVPVEKDKKAALISVISAFSSDSSSESDPSELPRYPIAPGPSLSTLAALSSPDPSLYATAIPSSSLPSTSTRRRGGRLRPPVYVAELTAYLKGLDPEGKKEEVDQEVERVEVGLREGEGLVRRKKGWGGELEENAVDLAFALMGLQDQYEIDGFEHSKRKIMIALVAACPTKVAPCIIEQYFTPSYSVAQRYTMLTALALGARELAGLSVEIKDGSLALAQQAVVPDLASFPSKQLSPAMHKRLLQTAQPTALEILTEDVTRITLSSVREEAESTIPEASKEKLVRVRRFASAKSLNSGTSSTTSSFTSLASDYFVMPLINRFWLYLREVASMPITQQGPYAGGSGSAVLLDPLILTQYLSTLALLLHAARLTPNFSDVLAPEVLHLVLALRTTGGSEDHPQVLEKEMTLLLVVFDAIVSFDGGRALMTRVEGGSNLIGESQGWATEVFERFDGGEVGLDEGKAGRAAAGVLLRIEEVLTRFRGRLGW
ncbi:BZ3500_MvSof-1268-A1-R1_Chr10-2g02997 [Microbotryum saponariae]|uniref:BZ3500_MvSof-1268-A1-R1_Chr10-2g02997 protein n=1 Tax=Microbotryum saponariae TaxID=289078 RepID=A0A2X0L5F3_9BASI|nr:BZ3500_MvSof-1268-A1-R1_Chr10-2g02997 [Microbotryum saponariae]